MKIFIPFIYDKEGFWEMLNDFLKIKEWLYNISIQFRPKLSINIKREM